MAPDDASRKTPAHLRRPSLSNLPNPMNWLGRSSSSDSTTKTAPYATAVKPVRISEPKLTNSLDLWARAPRSGPLGAGATVVRTPQEALHGSSARVSYGTHKRMKSNDSIDDIFEDAEEEPMKNKDCAELPSPPASPSLPPLPLFASKSSPDLLLRSLPSASTTSLPAPPTRAPPSPPMRPALKNARTSSGSPPHSGYFPAVPAVPAHLAAAAPQPPFEAILVSSVPSAVIDTSKIIVTLETNTASYRTSFTTLTSQPSHLTSYLKSVVAKKSQEDEEDQDRQSMRLSYASDAASSFNSIFHHHLTASGLLSQSTSSIHVFLDRPSAPYPHILAYLRSPGPGLPRHVQLSSCTSRTDASARLDALLDLRDEAAYLGLDDLQRLCTDEIRARYTSSHASHTHTLSTATAATAVESQSAYQFPPPPQTKHPRRGSNASVHSMQTLREEEGESDEGKDKLARLSRSRERTGVDADATTVPGLRDRQARSASREGAAPRSPGLSGSQSMRTRPAANWI
ncbi:hypothetical protein OE88DRAFT_1652461 [Heliocybe sulcata]|uniref:BTB domain-containing protein n=1 Tax=Heliocybe sulcata TaxID=5364 RepID=A0A5C3NQG0_9AGAM|nr:hypothetical protein OE88DRAFT_1652461 [Heliocybe sulcata]